VKGAHGRAVGTPGANHAVSSDLEEARRLIRERLVAENAVRADALERMEVMFDLTRLGTRLARDFESIHRAHGLTWAGFRIINMLWAVGNLEPSRLAHLTGSSRASTSSVLKSLEASGLIARNTNPSNRRLVRVSLTDKGREMLSESIPIQAQREQAWLAPLTTSELAMLKKVLDRLMSQAPPDSVGVSHVSRT
jgi:DNA-binding MarR family transcriptional regulator